jgi:hypothetical protein
MTTSTNPASMISSSATQRTDTGTNLPIDPMYAATLAVSMAVLIPVIVMAVKGGGESKRLRQEQATLAAMRAATNAKIHAGRKA